MTAREMFEKLGYYERSLEDNMSMCAVIIYDKKDNWKSIYFDYNKQIDVEGAMISLELLQAINKQVEELGWNNEQKRNRKKI